MTDKFHENLRADPSLDVEGRLRSQPLVRAFVCVCKVCLGAHGTISRRYQYEIPDKRTRRAT